MAEKTVTITLTPEQASKLTVILIQAAPRNLDAATSWGEFSREHKEDGSPMYPAAAPNAEYYHRCAAVCEEVKELLDDARFRQGVLGE